MGIYAVALTREPEERLVKKLSNAVCAELTSSDLSADPIFDSKVVKDEVLEVSLVEEMESEASRLVSESYADCAEVVSPELIALKRLSTSLPISLMPELTLPVNDESANKVVDEVLDGAVVSSVVRAVCALVISLLESAVETLETNSPSALLESAFAGVSFSNWAR